MMRSVQSDAPNPCIKHIVLAAPCHMEPFLTAPVSGGWTSEEPGGAIVGWCPQCAKKWQIETTTTMTGAIFTDTTVWTPLP